MPRYNDAPVSPEKIQMINDLLNDPIVGQLWKEYVLTGQPAVDSHRALIKTREEAFQRYAIARDKYLGLPPLKIQGVQGTHAKYRV